MTIDTEKAVRNSLLTLVARGSMILATAVGLPVAGWFMNRLADTADAIVKQVERTSVQLQLLQADVKYSNDAERASIDRNSAILSDHETRIRSIEQNPHLRGQ